MDRILMSACLMGQLVRFDGGHKSLADDRVAAWRAEGRLVPFCPEISGGLGVPRLPAEIEPGGTAAQIHAGLKTLRNSDGVDVSDAFMTGAKKALEIARREGCRYALLKEGSPSCGVDFVHAGRFDGSKISGEGVTAHLLRQNGIAVFSEHQISDLATYFVAAQQ